MILHTMTATFGKLEQQTLTLQPGLNILEAPNEWGKSTWCAFLAAMLYGIETRDRTTKAALADKERYAPWSGSPMAGRIELSWQGRNITLERKTRGRIPFGEFRAFETDTGLPVPELTAENCGKLLLGVEKSVFLRSGFIRLSDMPLTQDEALRRRLNALVTTGDESGASQRLSGKLRELKNRCRFHKTGLLPQAEEEVRQLEQKLHRLQALQDQYAALLLRQASLSEQKTALELHRSALGYAAAQEHAKKCMDAKDALSQAKDRVAALQNICLELPSQQEALQRLRELGFLRQQIDALQLEQQLLPSPPAVPEGLRPFQGLSAGDAIAAADRDYARYQALSHPKKKPLWLLSLLGFAFLALACAFSFLHLWLPAAGTAFCSVVFLTSWLIVQSAAKRKSNGDRAALSSLLQRYSPISPEDWCSAAREYGQKCTTYQNDLARQQLEQRDLDSRREALIRQAAQLTEGLTLPQYEAQWKKVLDKRAELDEALLERRRCQTLCDALTAARQDVPCPQGQDPLTFTEAETLRLLSDNAQEAHSLQLQLGQCLGQMEALGQKDRLRQLLAEKAARLETLQDTYDALTLAMDTLSQAEAQLQRRFAPRICQCTKALFSQLTENRYDRLILEEDLSLSVGAQGENTLHGSLWRSDGTVDQLYLALRLAVAEALAPEAPLILDDALVRFDDRRLSIAIGVLQEMAEAKQILLFTCQGREMTALQNL